MVLMAGLMMTREGCHFVMHGYSLIDPPTGKILYNRPHKQLSTLLVFEEATFPTKVDTSASCFDKIKKTTDPDSAS